MKPPPWKSLAKAALIFAPGFLLGFIVAHAWFRKQEFTGLARFWELLTRLKWQALLFVAALAGLVWLVKNLFDSERRKRYSVLTICLLASILAHVAGLFVMSSWVLTRAVYEAVVDEKEPEIVTIGSDALAQEKIALSIREQVAELPAPAAPPEVLVAQPIERQPLLPMEMPRAPAAPQLAQARADAFPMEASPALPPPPSLNSATTPLPAVRPSLPAMTMAQNKAKLEAAPKVDQAKTPEPKPAPSEVAMTAKAAPAPMVVPAVPATAAAATTRPATMEPLVSPVEPVASKYARPDTIARLPVPSTLPPMDMAKLAVQLEAAPKSAITQSAEPKPAPSLVDVTPKAAPVPMAVPAVPATAAAVIPRPATVEPLVSPVETLASKSAKPDTIARLPVPSTLPPMDMAKVAVQLETAPKSAVTQAVEPKPVPTQMDVTPRALPAPSATPANTAASLPKISLSPPPALAALPKMGMPPLPTQTEKPPKASPPATATLARASISAMPGALSLGPASIKLESRPQTSPAMALRDPKMRTEQVVRQLGGSKETEDAINRALEWFKQDQEADGRWSMSKHKGETKHVVACTGLVMLSYMGWGTTHTKDGPHRPQMERAMAWLIAMVKPDGDLRNKGDMYDQGIGTIALTEAYGLSRDEKLRDPAQRAVDFIVKAQSRNHGGWRYVPGAGDGDTSVFGWQLMALKSAQLAGLNVPEESFALSKRWLDQVGGGKHGGLYGYQGKSPKPAMAVEGMFAQQLLGLGQSEPRMMETAEYLKGQLPEAGRPDYYYWYYGCLALYQHQGPVWEDWNKRMQSILLPTQLRDGKDKGSWDPRGEYGDRSGRAVITALATLSLEVYYRYLPLYGLKGTANK